MSSSIEIEYNEICLFVVTECYYKHLGNWIEQLARQTIDVNESENYSKSIIRGMKLFCKDDADLFEKYKSEYQKYLKHKALL